MLNQVLLGRYIQGDSFIHRLDSRTKLLATFFFIFIIFLANNWVTYALLFAFVFLAIYLSQIPVNFFVKGIKPLLWIIIFTVGLQMFFTTGGTTYFQWHFIQITSFGIVNACYIFMRFVLIIVMSTLLTLTTPPLSLADSIEAILKPLEKIKFPVHELALMLSIAFRFVPTLMDEAQKIMNAQRARGVEFGEGSLVQQIKAVIPILVPLFVSAFNRALDLSLAMEARGYQGGEGRTKFRVLKYGKHDVYVFVAMSCLTMALVYLRG
ncbi:energy-coupling factor transport system permease protein [Granulicatella balaenopterae]|uniref:Energy-coupling factor transporter transmembrane protein EcfT n=1 Tax=Granulicatella balaenopterae TaxID=137733 RepID=A0A1H9J7D5_9LACT|nr:energy-coupling factor transporter transmembrane protein EcfT [Granulicatella balaenopterae]SEQ82649.1 energy-coupling factor transport system permease protein [Granulicatella balaenopterae]